MQDFRKALRIICNVIMFIGILFLAALGLDLLNLHSYVAAFGGAILLVADICAFFVFLNFRLFKQVRS